MGHDLEDKAKSLFICGRTCYEFQLARVPLPYAKWVCYKGSSEGIVIRQGDSCGWNYTEDSLGKFRRVPNIEFGMSKQSSPKCTRDPDEEVQDLSSILHLDTSKGQ